MWKIGCPNLANDTDCDAGLEGMGQAWSSPKVFKAAGYGSGTAPLLIMGGGHDDCEDADPNTCTSSSKGRHIYVFDAEAGTRLKTFNTDRPVVGDVFVVPDYQWQDELGLCRGHGRQRLSHLRRRCQYGDRYHGPCDLDDHEDRLARMRHDECLHEQPQVHVLRRTSSATAVRT